MDLFFQTLLTFALFAVCFFIALFLRLSLPERTPPQKEKKKKPRERRERVYLLADLKPVTREREPERAAERAERARRNAE